METQHSDLMDLWESAKDQWLDEEDPATKENLRVVYDDVMSMVEKTGTRLVQLEASLCGNGELTIVQLEAVHAPFKDCPRCRRVPSRQCRHTRPVFLLMPFESPASLSEIRLLCLLPICHWALPTTLSLTRVAFARCSTCPDQHPQNCSDSRLGYASPTSLNPNFTVAPAWHPCGRHMGDTGVGDLSGLLTALLWHTGGDSDVTVGSKRLRGEGITLPRRGLPPVSNPYGSAPMMGRPASMCAPPTIVAPPSSKAPGSAPIRHMMQD